MSDTRTPLELKDAIKRDYQAAAMARGGVVPDDALDEIAQSDLRIYDRVQAESKPAPAPKAPPPERANRAVEYAAKRGAQMFKTSNPKPDDADIRDAILSARPCQRGVKFDAMMRRISQIIMLRDDVTSGKLTNVLFLSEKPRLAREAINEFLWYRQPTFGGKRNPYFDMSQRDRARRFLRRLEDICDKSNAAFGPWWVK